MEKKKDLNCFKILITESNDYSIEALRIYSYIGNVTLANLTQEELKHVIHNYHIVVLRLGLKITREIIDLGYNLKYIVSPTTGLDHIDVDYASHRGIEIISLKGEIKFLEKIPSTAEHTWALLLSLIRKVPSAYEHVKSGGWNRYSFRGNNLKGKNLGIIGFGRVGKQVAKYAIAFGCNTAAFDPYVKNWPYTKVKRFIHVENLLNWSDIICIHIPYNQENENFLDKNLLSNLKDGSILINTSRAGIWDENVLVDLLNSQKIKALATDVLCDEQDDAQRVKGILYQYALKNNNVIITPHIAGATYESMEMTEIFVAKKLQKRLNKIK